MAQHSARTIGKFIAIGIAAGALSGMFGIGGATLIIPLLLFWVGMPQRRASGTSMLSILPTALVGAISYTVTGHINWVAAGLLAVGVVFGAQLGSYLLSKLRVSTLQLIFTLFLVVVVVSLWIVVPSRQAHLELSVPTALLIVVTGFVTGVLSGLLGVGGGIVVVPALMFFFGASDLEAKGTSLAMMIPGSISGSLGNVRRGNVDVLGGIVIGLSSAVMVPFSVMFASLIPPTVANILFSLYLSVIVVQMFLRWRKTLAAEQEKQ